MTNYVKQSFQWFFDMSTNTSQCQTIAVNAGGDDVIKRLAPFFTAFKKVKLGKVSIKMVPSATLPVDPTGLSYEAGESTVDPRDLFNPGLVRITNGEPVPAGSAGLPENIYYATMLDKRWYKFRLQNGFQRSASPLFWQVGQTHQDEWPGSVVNYPDETGGAYHASTLIQKHYGTQSQETGEPIFVHDEDFDQSSVYGLFQTGNKIKCGWMDTSYFRPVSADYMETISGTVMGLHALPEVPLITIILPKAYKTKFYYRVYVTETVMFKDPVAINPYTTTGVGAQTYQPADVFTRMTSISNGQQGSFGLYPSGNDGVDL